MDFISVVNSILSRKFDDSRSEILSSTFISKSVMPFSIFVILSSRLLNFFSNELISFFFARSFVAFVINFPTASRSLLVNIL